MKLLLRWAAMAVAVWVAAAAVPGIRYDNWKGLLVAALALGVLNALVKPLLNLLAIPLIVLTFGLFLVVTNALILLLTDWLVSGFHVAGFWSAVGGGLVISGVNLFLGRSEASPAEVGRTPPPRGQTRGPPPGKGPIIDV